MSDTMSGLETTEATSVNLIVLPATEVRADDVQAAPTETGFSEGVTRDSLLIQPTQPSSITITVPVPVSEVNQSNTDDGCTTVNLAEISCLGCGTKFSHNPPAVVDSQPFCSEECAVKFCERGVGDPTTGMVKSVSGPEGPLVSKILDSVMMDIVGDVPDDDPKTKLGRLKRQLEIKMAVPGETESLPMSKRPRLGSEKDSEETGNEGKDGDEAVLEWIAEDRESKRRAELRMKLGAEDLFQALKQEEGARSRVTISGSGGVGWFPWKAYLSRVRGRSAPATYFNQWDPPLSNRFEVGMLLEAVDEASGAQRRVVLAVVTDIVSVRLLLSLVGCPNTHPGHVVSVDSPDIHPIGWSKSQGRELESPVGVREELLSDFAKFVREQTEKGEWAPPSLFIYAGQVKPRYLELPRNLISIADGFLAGQRLEAVIDEKSPYRVRVVCVEEVIGDQIVIHADREPREPRYFKRYPIDSRQLHPVGFCYSKNHRLIVPRGMSPETFHWVEYLKSQCAKAAPLHLFKKRNFFRVGMKLEAVDPRHPLLIRVATVVAVNNYQLKIHFDDCDSDRDVWVDSDSRSIFHSGWCEKINHPLEAPPEFLRSIAVQSSPKPPSSGSGSLLNNTPSASISSIPISDITAGQSLGANNRHLPVKSWNMRDSTTGRFLKKTEVLGSASKSTASASVSQAITTASHSQPKVPKVSLITGNNTARKSTSGRLSLPLSPQLAARQSRPRTVSGPGVPVTAQSPFRVPAIPPQRGPQQMILPSQSRSLVTTGHLSGMSSEEDSHRFRLFFDISPNVVTGSLIGRQKLCFLPNSVEAKDYSELTAMTLQSIVICSDRPQAVLKTIPHGNPADATPRVRLEQVWSETLSTPLPKCDTETGMFRVIHQVLDAVGCSRGFVSRTRKREGEPSVVLAERIRVPKKDEESHVAFVNVTASPIGPLLSRNKLKDAPGKIVANTYPELAQNVVQFLVDQSKDPKAIYNMVAEARMATGKELYIILPDGSRKAMAMRCSPDFLTPTKVVPTPTEISKVLAGSDSSSARKSPQDVRPENCVSASTAERTTSSGPIAYFDTSVDTGPHVVPSMLFQLPKEIVADSYIDLVRRIVQALSAIAVSPRVVFESLDNGGHGEQFSMLWKDERGQLNTQVIAVEDTHESAWKLISKLLDSLDCSPYFVTPRQHGTQSEDPPSGSATFGLDVSLWPRATFDLSVNTGPMLDVRKLKELPERQSVSTVDVLHKRLVQMMVDCAVRPEQVFWLIPGGTSALEVTCPTSSDKLLRRKLRSCGSMAALRRYMESLLVNIRCSPKFVRIGDQSVGNQTIKTPSRKIGTKEDELREMAGEPHVPDKSNTVAFIESLRTPTPPPTPSPAPEPKTTDVAESAKGTDKSFEKTNPESWSVGDVVSYFQTTSDCQELASIFQKHEIDGSALLLLDRDALVQFMSVKVGPTLKVLRHVNELKNKWAI